MKGPLILCMVAALSVEAAWAEDQRVICEVKEPKERQVIKWSDLNFEELDRRSAEYRAQERFEIELNEHFHLGKVENFPTRVHSHDHPDSQSGVGLIFRTKI